MINFGIDKKFVKIYCGYGHSMSIAKDINEVYTWGDGSKGQLGKRGEDFSEPSVVDELSGRDIIKGYTLLLITGHVDMTSQLAFQPTEDYISGDRIRIISLESIAIISSKHYRS